MLNVNQRSVVDLGKSKPASGGGETWGSITGTLSDQTDLQNALNSKQDTLTAGTGIDITGNVISATGGGSVPTLTWYTGNTGTTLTIADTSSATLVKIYKNGILLQSGSGNDYTISGTTLTLETALIATDKITTEIY